MELTIGIIIWSLLIGLIAVLVVDSIVIIPAYHYGVLERFGERARGIDKIYYEGLGFKLPFIDSIIPVSMSLTPIKIEVGFTTADKIQMAVTGSLQYRPDPKGVDDDERNLFISISEAVIKNGIEDMLRDVLGGLGGVYRSNDFIDSRQAIGDLINNILQFKVPYHLRHIKPRSHEADKCEIKDCDHKEGCGVEGCIEGERVDANELIKFYNSHWKYLKKIHDEEKEKEHKKLPSSVEKRYGIEVEVFALANVGFSKEIEASFEKKKEADLRAEAFRKKLAMAGRVMRLAKKAGANVNAQEALNAADVSLTPEIARNKVVVSVEGQAGILGGVLGLLKKS